MKILFLYTKRMLAANKARTAVTFAGIVLSFALLTAVLTGTSSLFHFFSEYMKMRDGDYYGVIYNCDEEDEARLAQSGEVMQICRMGIVGVARRILVLNMKFRCRIEFMWRSEAWMQTFLLRWA